MSASQILAQKRAATRVRIHPSGRDESEDVQSDLKHDSRRKEITPRTLLLELARCTQFRSDIIWSYNDNATSQRISCRFPVAKPTLRSIWKRPILCTAILVAYSGFLRFLAYQTLEKTSPGIKHRLLLARPHADADTRGLIDNNSLGTVRRLDYFSPPQGTAHHHDVELPGRWNTQRMHEMETYGSNGTVFPIAQYCI